MSNTSKLRIRKARPEDQEAIREVTLAAYEQYAGVMPYWEPYRRHLLKLLAQPGPEERIVAELDGQIVGSVLLYPASAQVYAAANANGDWPELRLLAVRPSARGQGVGSALLDECIRRARQSGADRLGLHTEALMESAMQLYERKGFVRVPELDFKPREDVHVMGYRLMLGGGPAASGPE